MNMKKVLKIVLFSVVTWFLFAKSYKAITCVYDFSIDGQTDSLYFYANDDGELVDEFYVESTDKRYKIGSAYEAKIFKDKALYTDTKDVFEYPFAENKGQCPSDLGYIVFGKGMLDYSIALQSNSIVFAGTPVGQITFNMDKSSTDSAPIVACSSFGVLDIFKSGNNNVASDYNGKSLSVRFVMQNNVKKVEINYVSGMRYIKDSVLELHNETGNYVQVDKYYTDGGKKIRFLEYGRNKSF